MINRMSCLINFLDLLQLKTRVKSLFLMTDIWQAGRSWFTRWTKNNHLMSSNEVMKPKKVLLHLLQPSTRYTRNIKSTKKTAKSWTLKSILPMNLFVSRDQTFLNIVIAIHDDSSIDEIINSAQQVKQSCYKNYQDSMSKQSSEHCTCSSNP